MIRLFDKNDSCGCSTGAKFMGIAFLLAAGLYASLMYTGNITFSTVWWQILLITFIAAGIGKITGILYYKFSK